MFGRCASLFWETFGQGLDVDGQATDERYHQVLPGFLEIKNAGCANLDVVDLPEKCSMLQEPPFKIEETVVRCRTLGNVGICVNFNAHGWLVRE